MTQFSDCFASGSSSREFYLECLATPIANFSRVELPAARNTLTNFSNFVTRVFGDLNGEETHSNCKNHVFCTLRVIFRVVFKNFSFFPHNCDCSLSCLFLPLINSPCLLKNPPFSSSSLHQSSKIRYGFPYFLKEFHV